MCRDGPRSGPGNLCCEAENLGPLRAPSRHKAAPTGIYAWLEAGVVEVGAGLPAKRPVQATPICCHPAVIDDSNIYDPPELSTLGYLYLPIDRPQVGHCKVTAA
ncbi:protein of unknown function [Pseudomonas sp. JV551A1]|uniref:Uncharacterized protein n=1 Tax=Pseudomonas inefficax TaxID=2078786 RepID=A0AAQ1P8V1_9PSED|nr:protein of unknown function [Pseudomonas sp. JV551A1]SPO60750.1 protein of unknown function [Pseudomonas inefficax]